MGNENRKTNIKKLPEKKENYKYQGILEADTIKSRWKKKWEKNISENFTKRKALEQKIHQRN